MSYTFHAQRDNAAGTLLYPFSPGDPTLRLNSGQGSPFGPVSSTTPIRVTVYHPASLVGGAVVDPTMTATFNVVSLSGDNLGGLTFQRGNVSLVFPAGSTVARVITQDDFAEIQGAVNDLAESGTAGVSISSPNGTLAVGGTASLPTLDVLAVPQSAVTGLTAALAGKLAAANNLSDLANASTARANLGLGTAATYAATAFADATATVTVAKGGTGLTGITANRIPYASATDTYSTSANFTYDGTTLKTRANGSANQQEWGDPSGNIKARVDSGGAIYTNSTTGLVSIGGTGAKVNYGGFEAFGGGWTQSASTSVPAQIFVGRPNQAYPLTVYRQISSTSAERDAAIIDATWSTSTDATRKGRLSLYAADYTGTNREGIAVESDGSNANVALFGGNSWGGGSKVLYIANASTVPASNPSGGGLLYVEGGAIKYRGSSGTVTVIGPA